MDTSGQSAQRGGMQSNGNAFTRSLIRGVLGSRGKTMARRGGADDVRSLRHNCGPGLDAIRAGSDDAIWAGSGAPRLPAAIFSARRCCRHGMERTAIELSSAR